MFCLFSKILIHDIRVFLVFQLIVDIYFYKSLGWGCHVKAFSISFHLENNFIGMQSKISKESEILVI